MNPANEGDIGIKFTTELDLSLLTGGNVTYYVEVKRLHFPEFGSNNLVQTYANDLGYT